MAPMIIADHLTKVYPGGKGIFDVSFSVQQGEVFGFLGPNGAGKTTTIRNLLGFTNPKSGSCTVAGLDCRRDAAQIQRSLGYVPGEIAFFDKMTGLQFLHFIARMRNQRDTTRRDALIERFELDPTRLIRKMSKGMKQKVGLVAAFMHDPSVLILDEPTSGLDPLMQHRFIELVQQEQGRGKTVLLSSHLFEEVERTCERAAIIRDGYLVASEDIASLKASQRKIYEVTVADAQDLEKITSSGLEFEVVGKNHVQIHVSDDFTPMLQVLAQCKVLRLETAAQTLEQTFLSYYGKEGK